VATRLLVPAPSSFVDLYPVSTEVNNVRTDGPQLVERVDPTDGGDISGQATLL
jgi:putative SOS response-associated peptidase YedK